LGRLNELLITAIEQAGNFSAHEDSGGDGYGGLISIVDWIVTGNEDSGHTISADQKAACNCFGGCYIKALGTQEFECLIEVWMARLFLHDCFPVYEAGLRKLK